MLEGYKTYITAAIAVLTAALGYLNQEVTLEGALTLGFTAVLAVFIRRGVKVDTGSVPVSTEFTDTAP